MASFPDTITAGQWFTFQMEATNDPTSWTATGLPAGLTLNAATGQISGVIYVPGVYSFQLIATNGTGDSAPMFVFIEVSPSATPVVTGVNVQSYVPWLNADPTLTDLQFDLLGRGVTSYYSLNLFEGDTCNLAILLTNPGPVTDATTIWLTGRTDVDSAPIINLQVTGSAALTTVSGGSYYAMALPLSGSAADAILDAIANLDDPGAGAPAVLTLTCQLAVLDDGNVSRSQPFTITITERIADAGLPALNEYGRNS